MARRLRHDGSFAFICALVGMVLTAGCSSGGGDGGGGAVAAGKMSAEKEQAFEAWLASPIKSCQAMEIVGGSMRTEFGDGTGIPGMPSMPEMPAFPGFPGMPTPTPSAARPAPSRPVTRTNDAIEKGVDLQILATKTKGSLWIGDRVDAKIFAVLSGGSTAFHSGVGDSNYEENMTINGVSSGVKVTTQYSGYDCTVTVNGVERAKVKIAKTVEIAYAAETSKITFDPFKEQIGSKFKSYPGVAQYDAGGVGGVLSLAMKSSDARNAALAALGYSGEQSEKYFVIGTGVRPYYLALEKPQGGIAMAGRSDFILTDAAADVVPVSGQTRSATFALLLKTEKSEIGGVAFASGTPVLSAISRNVQITSAGGEFTYRDGGSGSTTLLPATPTAADSCVADRVSAARRLYAAKAPLRQSNPLSSQGAIYGTCAVFDTDVLSRHESSGQMVVSMNEIFADAKFSEQNGTFSFQDWESSVTALTQQALNPGSTSILSSARPAHVFQAADQVIGYARIEPALTKLDQEIRWIVARMIVKTSERMMNSYANVLTDRTLGSVIRLGASLGKDFVQPFGRLADSFEGDARHGLALVTWAEGTMTASYIAMARDVYNNALVVGYQPYLSETHARLFDVRPSERELTEMRDRLRSFRTEADKHGALKPAVGVLASALLKSSIPSSEYPQTILGAAMLAVGNPDLVGLYTEIMTSGGQFLAFRQWSLGLTPADQQAMSTYLSGARDLDVEEAAKANLRALVKTMPSSAALQTLANSIAPAKSFLASEAQRAAGSTRDTFYESKAKELAKRIIVQGFSAADVSALEVFAKVAAADMFCSDRATISLRLECVGLDRFAKTGTSLLADLYQGRYVTMAQKMDSWLTQIGSSAEYGTVRRNLRGALFQSFGSSAWGNCTAAGFSTNLDALEKSVTAYIAGRSDFASRVRLEREVQTALNRTCP